MKFLFNIYASLPLTSLARLVSALLIGCLVVSLTHATERKLDPAEAGNPIKLDLQMGLDVWQLSTPDRTTSVLKGVDRLYLADSYTTWTYRNPAPWVKTTGEWDINSQLNLTYKARADQSMGAKVDDFNHDYRLSPNLGFRTGGLDMKSIHLGFIKLTLFAATGLPTKVPWHPLAFRLTLISRQVII